jgi:GTPase
MSSHSVVDLTRSDEQSAPKRQKVAKEVPPILGSALTAEVRLPAKSAPARTSAAKKPTKKDQPHVLIWVCSAGKGQGRNWKEKALKIVGVYRDKAEAEAKKDFLMTQYDCCGHGDILVGGTWEDEIDLVVRPAGECTL